jgi:hypothetical protein
VTERAPIEDRLARLLHDATDGIHASDGFWDEVDARAERRTRRRTAVGSASVVASALAVAVVVALLGPGLQAVPTPGTIDDEVAGPARVAATPDTDRAELRRLLELDRSLRFQLADLDRAVHLSDVAAGNAALHGAQRSAGEHAATATRLQLAAAELREEHRAVVFELRQLRRGGFPPLTGYGEFGDVPLPLVDMYELTTSLARCLLDHSVPVALLPPGDGIAFLDDHVFATDLQTACMAGLGIDDQPVRRGDSATDHEALRQAYDEAVYRCLRDAGAEVTPPPTDGTAWLAYDQLPDADDALRHRCPAQPVGGLGAFRPGDDVTPAGPLPDLPHLPVAPAVRSETARP